MNIFLDTIGCRLNQSEIESIANTFRALGHQIVGDPAEADLAIVNTCAVTVKAAADSRKQLRHAARAGAGKVIATGCWATLYPDEALGLDAVDEIVLNDQKDHLVADFLGLPAADVAALPLVREPLPGDRARTRAFIKVQEGCNSHCTYCVTTLARGRSQSRPLDAVQADIRAAITGGTQEVVLTGVELGAWGKDLSPALGLSDLIAAVLQNSDLHRLRLSSIEPWDFDPPMLALWQDERLCHHLHIPLQSGNDRVLRAMGRAMKSVGYARLIATIRKAIPDVAITTDVIAGFPGETDAEFEATRDFIRQMGFAGGHVFTYSPRPGTAAYKMKDQVERSVAKARNAELRQVFHALGLDYQKQFIGETLSVLWETHTETSPGTWLLSGLTGNYLRVYAPSDQPLWNQISQVKIIGENRKRGGLKGSIELSEGKRVSSA
jgi:threonylcarbamoyladenosine tRNA methylthiotransferase MtaB